ncbi:MAG: Rho termination factor N-terminal domain-containing protein, partial [Stackebrandtia sp.]
MSDTTGTTPEAESGASTTTGTKRKRGGSGMASMLMPELQKLANSLGIPSIGRMRKSELITAIQDRQSSDAKQPSLPAADNADTESDAPATESKSRRATRSAGPPQPRRSTVVAAEAESTGQATATVAVAEESQESREEQAASTERRQRRERQRPFSTDNVSSESVT